MRLYQGNFKVEMPRVRVSRKSGSWSAGVAWVLVGRVGRGPSGVAWLQWVLIGRVVVVGRCGMAAVDVSKKSWSWSAGVAWVQWPLVGIEQNGRGQQV